jgi:hypothetical protein
MKDPIVEEVRETRLKIEQECLKSGISYKEHLLAVQKQYEGRVVAPPANAKNNKKIG